MLLTRESRDTRKTNITLQTRRAWHTRRTLRKNRTRRITLWLTVSLFTSILKSRDIISWTGNVWLSLGILSFQYLPSAQGNLAGQELQEYPSLPSLHHFLEVHGDLAGRVDLHVHKSQWKDQAKNHGSALRYFSSSWGSDWFTFKNIRNVRTVK